LGFWSNILKASLDFKSLRSRQVRTENDMTALREVAEMQARAIVKKILSDAGDEVDLVHCASPPVFLSRVQERLWRELLVQSIQRQLRSHSMTV
jgi:hypothetical protein